MKITKTNRLVGEMTEQSRKQFRKAVEEFHCAMCKLEDGGFPSYWTDGFKNVLLRGETSGESDNPFLEDHEPSQYANYRAGARAAVTLLKCKSWTA